MKKGVSLTNFVSQNEIEQRIFLIRRHKVMVDRDLAELYGVETKNLNRQVKRNKDRFPDEFMFQLNTREKEELVTKCHRFQHASTAAERPRLCAGDYQHPADDGFTGIFGFLIKIFGNDM